MAEQPGDELDALFDGVIEATLRSLPDPFLSQLGSVAIVVEDEATPAQLTSVGAYGLYGLYQGVPRTRWGVDNVPLPSKITLFRGPLTRANPGSDRLTTAIEATLLHEIAHHLGIDDERIHALLAGGEASRLDGQRRKRIDGEG
jgi:predicted Zn-dependent protease with MMP-like domain